MVFNITSSRRNYTFIIINTIGNTCQYESGDMTEEI